MEKTKEKRKGKRTGRSRLTTGLTALVLLIIAFGSLLIRGIPRVPAPIVPTASEQATRTIKPTMSVANGQIAFVSRRDGTDQIYAINVDGSNEHRITRNSGKNYNHTIAPDGKSIVFESERDGTKDLYRINVDGSAETRLTQTGYNTLPTWSPSGDRIVLLSESSRNVALVYPDGSGLTVLPNLGFEPTWSPDGKRIAFSGRLEDGGILYVMNADGSNLVRIFDGGSTPTWSPDGKHIAFSSYHDGRFRLYTVGSDGSGLVQLTDKEGSSPKWSPDGNHIAFTSEGETNGYQIYVIDPDGTNLRQLTGPVSLGAEWSPDSRRIAFQKTIIHELYTQIYIINLDGSNEIRLTSISDNIQPLWIPRVRDDGR